MKHFILIALIALGINTTSTSAQTLQESANFANLYLTQYFGTCFPGRQYQKVVVNRSQVMSANSVGMAGTVTFLDAFGLPKDNYFELLMTLTPYNMIDVKFGKLNQVFGSQYWEYCNNSFPAQQPQTPTYTNNASTQQRPLQPGEVSIKQFQIQNTIDQTLMYSQRMINSSSKW